MRLVRKIHRYFALVLGLAFLVWVVSGILMLLPGPTPNAMVKPKHVDYDFTAITLPPADIIESFVQVRGSDSEILQVVLGPFVGRLVYKVQARRQQPLLFDAYTGDLVDVTPELALAVARDRLRSDVGEARIERLDERIPTYPWGALPAYQMKFDDGRGTIAYVAVSDASIFYTDRTKQLWHLITNLHTFSPLGFLIGHDISARIQLVTAVLCLVLIATGYYMEFSPRSKSRSSK